MIVLDSSFLHRAAGTCITQPVSRTSSAGVRTSKLLLEYVFLEVRDPLARCGQIALDARTQEEVDFVPCWVLRAGDFAPTPRLAELHRAAIFSQQRAGMKRNSSPHSTRVRQIEGLKLVPA